MEALDDLKRELASTDLDQRDRAAAEAAVLLELHHHPIEPVNFPDYYAQIVRPTLLARPLRLHEERELIAHLGETFLGSQHHPPRDAAPLLNALGKSKPWLVIGFFAGLLTSRRASLSENELHQVVHALDHSLFLYGQAPEFEMLVSKLRRSGVRSALMHVAEISPSHVNSCMPEDAKRIISRVMD